MKQFDNFLKNTIKYKEPIKAQQYLKLMTRIANKSPEASNILIKQGKLLQNPGCGVSASQPGMNAKSQPNTTQLTPIPGKQIPVNIKSP